MIPACPLPLPPSYKDPETYINDLLKFVTSSKLHVALCGDIHILDFFVKEHTVYEEVFPEEWRTWFDLHDLRDLLDFFLREEVVDWSKSLPVKWRGRSLPPTSLVQYISQVRDLSLTREVPSWIQESGASPIPHHVATGMGPKKAHEVRRFSAYVQELRKFMNLDQNSPGISHLVDFGAGQNYLGRALASDPYHSHVIAVERRGHNVSSARQKDVKAFVAPKEGVMRNKKAYRASKALETGYNRTITNSNGSLDGDSAKEISCDEGSGNTPVSTFRPARSRGTIIHVEKDLDNGDLRGLQVDSKPDITDQTLANGSDHHQYLVMSIHSCGDLSHHGLRSLVLNQNVRAVAIVGCCYNLLTEKMTVPSYKYANLRWASTGFASSASQRSEARFSSAAHEVDERDSIYQDRSGFPGNPSGFPMSQKLTEYPHMDSKGLSLNITARMMAVQAPANWKQPEWEGFFLRHFYRALLQRLFLDKGVIVMTNATCSQSDGYSIPSRIPSDASEYLAKPIIIGKLGKSCYGDFVSYVRGALERIYKTDDRRALFRERIGMMTNDDIRAYETTFAFGKKQIGILWTLMAYSAGLLEATIIVDRWLWLTEQESVRHAWVEPVFDYSESPRNLVVVGIK